MLLARDALPGRCPTRLRMSECEALENFEYLLSKTLEPRSLTRESITRSREKIFLQCCSLECYVIGEEFGSELLKLRCPLGARAGNIAIEPRDPIEDGIDRLTSRTVEPFEFGQFEASVAGRAANDRGQIRVHVVTTCPWKSSSRKHRACREG